MAKVTTENFVDLLGRSGLVDKEQIAAAVGEFQASGGDTSDGQALAHFLVDRQTITGWQAEKLLEGRHKGFFLRKYKLLDHLGTGGMSMVYLAEHVDMHRRVAIKVLPQSRTSDPAYLSRFYNEARAAGSLSHPNIVQTYDFDSDRMMHYIVMEYVRGPNLQELVKRDGVLGYSRAANYIAQAARALAYAHESGLVHRDVKPANLLVDEKNVVKLLDLGLAFFSVEGQTSLTLANEDNVLGTADYLAPEQALNSHNVDGRADIYSLGGTLYFLLTGHPPFDEGNIAQRILAHQTQEPPSIFTQRPTVPRELVEICTRMMAKKPEDRFQTMDQVAQALEAFVAESGASDSSLRMRRFGESPSGLMRRPGLSGDRLRRSVDESGSGSGRGLLGGGSYGDRGGGSSIFGREQRPASGSKSGSGTNAGSGSVARTQRDDEEELELTVLPEEKPNAGSKPGVSKAPGSTISRASDSSTVAKKGAVEPPGKPIDFTSWISEELAEAPRASASDSRTKRASTDSSNTLLWMVVGAGIAVVVLLAALMLVFSS